MTTPPDKPNRPSSALILFLILPIIGLIAAGIVALNGKNAETTAQTPLPVRLPPQTQPSYSDKPATDFELTTLDGSTAKLSDYKGRVVFLNFWATWCVPCQRELPAFKAFMETQPADGPIVLAVNIGETGEQAKAYLDERGISGFPVLLDEDFKVRDLYGVPGIPVTFAIDPTGMIRAPHFGEIKLDDLNAYVEEYS